MNFKFTLSSFLFMASLMNLSCSSLNSKSSEVSQSTSKQNIDTSGFEAHEDPNLYRGPAGISAAYQVTPFEIVENSSCNEIRVRNSPNALWESWDNGGPYTVETEEFQSLQKNLLERVKFSQDNNYVSFQYEGRKIASESLDKQVKFTEKYANLVSESSGKIIGKVIALVEHPGSSERKPSSNEAPEYDKESTEYLNIVHGSIYYNPVDEKSGSRVPCAYVGNEIQPESVVQNRKCVWFDRNSKTKNHKPYCISQLSLLGY